MTQEDLRIYKNLRFKYMRYKSDWTVEMLTDLFRLVQTDMRYMYKEKETFKAAMQYFARRHRLEDAEAARDLWKRSLFLSATEYFDAYLEAVEWSRKPKQKFYAPRKHYLKPIVEAYQDVADGKLELLTISMPKRSGKTQTGINFINWLSGRHPEKSSLIEGTGDALVDSFYKGILEYVQKPTNYNFYDVFPYVKVAQTNADTKIINFDEKSRFPTIMCRSIDSRQVGLSEATNVLYLDDCVEGREEAKNRRRLDEKWEVISGDIIGRALEGTPIVICGTRYSLYDPIGRLQEHASKRGWNWKAIEIPALNDNDESNYEYFNPKTNKPTFTADYFIEQRDLITKEQWESEFQQQPFEAKGLMFKEDELNYFYELPTDKEPDTIIAVCDPAGKGEDSTAMPIGYVYGNDVFIIDVVFDDAPPNITKPQIAKKLIDYKVANITFEVNTGGDYYARDIDTLVRQNGGRVGIRTQRAVVNKQTRIEFASDIIIRDFYFLHKTKYDKASQYAKFMKELTTYTRSGKNRHDDAADSLAMLENELRKNIRSVVEVFERPF